jgi:hypothetical protein
MKYGTEPLPVGLHQIFSPNFLTTCIAVLQPYKMVHPDFSAVKKKNRKKRQILAWRLGKFLTIQP